jgi:hypothetical protein
MASSDARPIPRKNTAFRVTFDILDADGDLVTGATGLDSEVSLDGAGFADCTNEAAEIATSSGMYYLDLTAAEMNADTVAIIVKTSSSGAKTTPLVLYPESAGDIRADLVDAPNSTAVTAIQNGLATTGEAAAALTAYDPPTKAELDSGLLALNDPTAVEIATEILTIDWTTVTGEASRSVLNALRALRNKVSLSGAVLTVTEEDDTTAAWIATVTSDATADPVTAIDPA